jgi:arylsulfatase A-like enzyme
MKNRLLFCLLIASVSCQSPPDHSGTEKPNIIYILADDMGYGDVSAYNPDSKINTPHIDQLAEKGMAFTDAHSNSAVCTPTRYGILTGRYAWRSTIKKGVTWSWDTLIISPERTTAASLLKDHGYQTACIGKWHLGLGWQKDSSGVVDVRKSLSNGPNSVGFDYSFVIPASLDIPPYVYIENHQSTTQQIDTIDKNDGKGFWRKGPIGDDLTHESVLPTFTQKAVEYIRKGTASEQPFFLYLPLPAPHTPILPTAEFKDKSGTNEYGDFVLMVDDVVGQIVAALDAENELDNTLIIFTTDNGCSPMANFEELDSMGHSPSFIYRGHKADIFEGGHRVPFLAQWPAKIPAGQKNANTICHTDFLATCASILGDTLAPNAGEDSYSLWPILQGQGISDPLREATVLHSIDGVFSIRQGPWKLIFGPGSGGWSYPRPKEAKALELPPVQLYNLDNDPSETKNLHSQEPELVQQLTDLMQKYIDQGRSTPGSVQKNDTPTSLYLN